MEATADNGSTSLPAFEATWYPRIGPEATQKLKAYTWFSRHAYLCALLPAGAGILIGSGWLGDVVGGVFAVATIWSWCMLIYTQRRTANAISHWRGIEIRWLPRMTPENFDKFCQKYHVPEHNELGPGTEVREIGLPGPPKPDRLPDEAGITRWKKKRAEKLGSRAPSADRHPPA